jgi:hypothetical protein
MLGPCCIMLQRTATCCIMLPCAASDHATQCCITPPRSITRKTPNRLPNLRLMGNLAEISGLLREGKICVASDRSRVANIFTEHLKHFKSKFDHAPNFHLRAGPRPLRHFFCQASRQQCIRAIPTAETAPDVAWNAACGIPPVRDPASHAFLPGDTGDLSVSLIRAYMYSPVDRQAYNRPYPAGPLF